jgi:hypothetical protein
MMDSGELAHWERGSAEPITAYHEYNSLVNNIEDDREEWRGFRRNKKGQKVNPDDVQLRPDAVLTPDGKLLIVLNNDTLSFYDVSNPRSPV